MTWNFHENCNLSTQDKDCLSFPWISSTFSVFVVALQITVIHDESRENRTRAGPNWMIYNAWWKPKWWKSVYCGKWNNSTTIRFYTEYFTETLCINSTHIQQPENDFRIIYIIHTNLFDHLENLTLRHSTMLRPIFVTIDPDDVYQFRRVKQEL